MYQTSYSVVMHSFYLNVPTGTALDIKWFLLEAILSVDQVYWAEPCTLALYFNVLSQVGTHLIQISIVKFCILMQY